jgi:hypothetical protein
MQICEHLPLLAQLADRYTIVRSLTHTGTNHGTSAYHMLTGHIHFAPGTLRHPTPEDFPSIGCAVNRYCQKRKHVPGYVALPSVLHDGDGGEVPGQGPGILGHQWAPFYVHGDPTRPDFSFKALTLPANVDAERMRHRIDLQTALQAASETLGRIPAAQAMAMHYRQAYQLLQSAEVRQAFALAQSCRENRRRGCANRDCGPPVPVLGHIAGAAAGPAWRATRASTDTLETPRREAAPGPASWQPDTPGRGRPY